MDDEDLGDYGPEMRDVASEALGFLKTIRGIVAGASEDPERGLIELQLTIRRSDGAARKLLGLSKVAGLFEPMTAPVVENTFQHEAPFEEVFLIKLSGQYELAERLFSSLRSSNPDSPLMPIFDTLSPKPIVHQSRDGGTVITIEQDPVRIFSVRNPGPGDASSRASSTASSLRLSRVSLLRSFPTSPQQSPGNAAHAVSERDPGRPEALGPPREAADPVPSRRFSSLRGTPLPSLRPSSLA